MRKHILAAMGLLLLVLVASNATATPKAVNIDWDHTLSVVCSARGCEGYVYGPGDCCKTITGEAKFSKTGLWPFRKAKITMSYRALTNPYTDEAEAQGTYTKARDQAHHYKDVDLSMVTSLCVSKKSAQPPSCFPVKK